MFLVGYTDSYGELCVESFDIFSNADNFFEMLVTLGYSSVQMSMRIIIKDVNS